MNYNRYILEKQNFIKTIDIDIHYLHIERVYVL